MIEMIQGKTTRFLEYIDFVTYLGNAQKVIVDLGTGDGKFAYSSAKKNPQNFFIGIDADRNGLVEYSHKITRKPSKGGLSNIMYLISNVNNLPEELSDLADEVWIILPWGSLLQAVVTGERIFLENIAKITKKNGEVFVLVNYDLQYEPSEIIKLGLPNLTPQYLQDILRNLYLECQLELICFQNLSNEEAITIPSTWSRRLGFGRPRQTTKLIFRRKSI